MKEGLPIATEDWVNGVKKRWTWTKYTQDNENLSYVQNPRVTESKIGDTENGNVRRTTIEYNNAAAALYGLPSDTFVYDTNQTTILKKSHTEYNLSTAYTSRRIIGLPSLSESYGYENGALNLVGKTTYAYDEGNFSDTSLEQTITPIMHDTTKYGASFKVGRGNLTSVTRWDVTGATANITSNVKYNIAGSPVASIDPLGRTVKTSYADKFEDGNNSRNTFAYPTKLTDPNGNFSEVKYRFDIGANVWAKSPAPAGNTVGKITARDFDTIGRLIKQTLWKDTVVSAYTRYEPQPNPTYSRVFTTVTDADNNGVINTNDEVLSESWTDGAGRAIKARSPMTFDASGATQTWVGQKAEYDVLGRTKKQYVPTEINGSWQATGDDYSRGWQFTSSEFDWKGRVTREIGLDNVDRIFEYNGCGCAGGQTTTIKGELLPEGRRTQKVYSDILGRSYKSEILDWSSNVYSTSVTKFNGRDQAVSIRQFEGGEKADCTTGECQETTVGYDGHGRKNSQHSPQQNADKSTVYTYNADDQINSMTDGRGASSTYTYNDPRGLLTKIDYSLPGAAGNFPTINPNSSGFTGGCNVSNPDFPDCLPPNQPPAGPYLSSVTYAYDALGNRTNMTDTETGSTTYQYDNLSRMTGETKQLKADWTIPNKTFNIQYAYELTGRLKSVTDPFGQRIDYAADKLGRLKQITGTPFGTNNSNQPLTNYISDIQYRSFGALKQVNYSNGVEMKQTFDNRLRVSQFEVSNPANATTPINLQNFIKKNYEYNNDNTVKFSDDNGSNVVRDPAKFDRSYSYDFAGRMTSAKTGIEARGGVATDRSEVPYKDELTYTAFGDVASMTSKYWTQDVNETHNWVNHRDSNYTYDADGRAKTTPKTRFYYDAAGSVVMTTNTQQTSRMIYNLDGEGRRIRQKEYVYYDYQYHETNDGPDYFIYSTVLGKVLTEVNKNGVKLRTYIYGLGGVVATANERTISQTGVVVQEPKWEHRDPSNATYITTDPNGERFFGEQAELNPAGVNVRTGSPNPQNLSNPGGFGNYPFFGDTSGGPSCYKDWVLQESCGEVFQLIGAGIADFGPLNQVEHDGGGWGHYECPGGELACGYYYHYAYDTNSLINEDDPSLGFGACINCGQAIYLHPADTYNGPFFFNLTGTNTPPPSQPPTNPPANPPANPPNSNPCLGKILNFTSPAGKDWGFRHITPRHIEQTAGFLWKSRYTFSPLERGLPKKQERVSEVDQKTVQNGAVNSSFNNTFVYIYAFPDFDYTIQGISGPIGVRGFEDIGIDNLHGGDTTNVNTVVVNSDCSNVITSYPGLPQNGGRINGNPRWWNPGRGWTWRR
jgi:YD repeat-containing protein